jgi:hypothetical protein
LARILQYTHGHEHVWHTSSNSENHEGDPHPQSTNVAPFVEVSPHSLPAGPIKPIQAKSRSIEKFPAVAAPIQQSNNPRLRRSSTSITKKLSTILAPDGKFWFQTCLYTEG